MAIAEKVGELKRQVDISQLATINGERAGGYLECYVPLEMIFTEDVPVAEAHVEELSQSMKDARAKDGGTGQLTPVLLGKIDGEDKLRIIDGFHRTASMKAAGEDTVFATVRDCTWEEVTDLRILTARTHKLVQFARIVEWVADAWGRTKWGDQIDVTQAFVLGTFDSSGSRLGLEPEVAEAVKKWVDKKCTQWQTHPMTVYQHLSTASVTDPELVAEARSKRHGKKLEYITPGHLKVIAKGFPNQFDFQRLISTTAKAQNLTIPATRSLVSHLLEKEDLEISDARAIIDKIDWETWIPEYARKISERENFVNFGTDDGRVFAPTHMMLSAIKKRLTELAYSNGSAETSSKARLEQASQEIVELEAELAAISGLVNVLLKKAEKRPQKTTKPKVAKLSSPSSGPARSGANLSKHTRDPSSPADMFRSELSDYLSGEGGMPIIETRAQIRMAEAALAGPSSGPMVNREDLREEIKLAYENLKKR